jgi:hypothetical protein
MWKHTVHIRADHLQVSGGKGVNLRPEIDEIDVKILKTLLEDPRTSCARNN